MPEDRDAPSFDAVQCYDFGQVGVVVDDVMDGIVFWRLDEAGDLEAVGGAVDVLWSFDGVFAEVVDGREVLALVVARLVAAELDGLRAPRKDGEEKQD